MIFYFKFLGLFFIGVLIQIFALRFTDTNWKLSMGLRISAFLIAISMLVWIAVEWRKGVRSKVPLLLSIPIAILLVIFCGAVV